MAEKPEVKLHILSMGDPAVARDLFPGALIDVVDNVSLKIPARFRQVRFDSIVSYLALPRVHYLRARRAIGEWKESLKEGGSIHIFTPSLEWAAAQILSEEPSNAIFGVLYGGEVPNNYQSGYTMMDLRSLLEMNGLAAVYARTGTYEIREGETLYQCDSNYVMALKPKKADKP